MEEIKQAADGRSGKKRAKWTAGGRIRKRKTKWADRTSLRWKFIPYIVAMAAAMIAGFVAIGVSVNEVQDYLLKNYAKMDRKVWEDPLVLEDGSVVKSLRVTESREWESQKFRLLYGLTDVGQTTLIVIWAFVCMLLPGTMYYRRYLREPLRLLTDAAARIADNNLDFQIVYTKKDEMGQLCGAFEQMRLALQENNLQMWRQMEERRRLNAAFAHDLRTPLTVLKGQADLLIRYAPSGRMPAEKVGATAVTMKKHIGRLEDYVQAMSRLQRLEDVEIEKRETAADELIQRILESGRALCGAASPRLRFLLDTSHLHLSVFCIDVDIVMQVCDNLLSNAVRYAKTCVTVTLSDAAGFAVTVCDDGPGFSKEALERADQPFYHAEAAPERTSASEDEPSAAAVSENASASEDEPAATAASENVSASKDDSPAGTASKRAESAHMGMGLHICRILCEKHGGYLHLSNTETGACVKAGF